MAQVSQGDVRDALKLSPFLDHREVIRLPSGGHVEFYAADDSAAPLLIFLPGISTYVELYAGLLYRLSQQGFNVAALDYPGHGYSTGERGQLSVTQVSVWVSELIDVFEERCPQSQIGILGYSIGSLLALKAAETDARIQRLICGTLLVPEYAPDVLHSLGWMWMQTAALWTPRLKVPLTRLLDFSALIKALPGVDVLEHDPRLVMAYPLGALADLFSVRCNSVKAVQSFKMLVVQGDTDEVLPLSYVQSLQGKLVQPFDLVVVPGGHMLPWTATEQLCIEMRHWWFSVS